MSWLRTSPLRQSFSRSNRNSNNSTSSSRPLDSSLDFDQKACYDSFCKHWQQVYDIILRVEVSPVEIFYDFCTLIQKKTHPSTFSPQSRPITMMSSASSVIWTTWSHCCWSNCSTAIGPRCRVFCRRRHRVRSIYSARICSTNCTNGVERRDAIRTLCDWNS